MEQFVNTAEDPSYMEKVVKEAVGSMYIGTSRLIVYI